MNKKIFQFLKDFLFFNLIIFNFFIIYFFYFLYNFYLKKTPYLISQKIVDFVLVKYKKFFIFSKSTPSGAIQSRYKKPAQKFYDDSKTYD